MRWVRRLTVLPIVAIASSAVAQDQAAQEDWRLHRDDRQRVVAAFLPTTAGLSILVRCQRGALTAFVAGLPEDKSETRTIGLAMGDDDIHDATWTSGSDGTSAFSDLPAPFARSLREGGQVQLRVPNAATGGRSVRYVLDLPPSTAAIDQTLTACDRPLVDPRDAELDAVGENGLPTEITWERPPRPTFPNSRYARGFAVLSCIANEEGRARDCVIETEHPHDGGFGEASIDSMKTARLSNRLNPDAPIPPSRFTFRTLYTMSGYETDEDRQRVRESNRARREAREGS